MKFFSLKQSNKKVNFFLSKRTEKKKSDLGNNEKQYLKNLLRARDMFISNYGELERIPEEILKFKKKIVVNQEFHLVRSSKKTFQELQNYDLKVNDMRKNGGLASLKDAKVHSNSKHHGANGVNNLVSKNLKRRVKLQENQPNDSKNKKTTKKQTSWNHSKILCGHHGWVRCVDVDITNDFFVTGSADRTIKIWDMASCDLKLTLTGHTDHVRGVKLSQRHPYLFSVGLDQTVKCWDLEMNKVIRNYHGHLSGVFCLNIMKDLEIILTGGRDSVCRVWDIRTKKQIMVLTGHKNTVACIDSQTGEPHIITGSHDQTIRCWDITVGRPFVVLTHHKKSIRSLFFHSKEYTFCSGSGDNIKVWKCPESKFLRNFNKRPHSMINTLAINHKNILVAGHQTGHLSFWDWKNGNCFQNSLSQPQPGSIEAEAGIEECCFDQSGKQLITVETDKTIKIWEDRNL